MKDPTLPSAPHEVLDIPMAEIPDVIRGLVQRRRLSPLMRRINADLLSEDPALRRTSRTALRRLGFPD